MATIPRFVGRVKGGVVLLTLVRGFGETKGHGGGFPDGGSPLLLLLAQRSRHSRAGLRRYPGATAAAQKGRCNGENDSEDRCLLGWRSSAQT